MILGGQSRMLFLAAVIGSIVALGFASASGAATKPASGPTVVSQAAYPITVKAGDYSILNLVLAFAPGAGIPNHVHGGYVVVTVLSGQISLLEKGMTKVVKAGQSWTEKAGDVHAVVNRGKTTVRVAVSILLPKGAEATTLVH
ncbi:MAG TPA: cupin domain-containing protein [Anaerolineales bacterium]